MFDRNGPFSSTVVRKVLMGVTGLALVGFVVEHLLGNLLLLNSNPDYFNQYAYTFERLGFVLYVVEAILVAFFLVHIGMGVAVTWANRKARPVKYEISRRAGGVSRKTVSSVSMIWTGLALFVFLVLHLIHFKYGPGRSEGYVTQLGDVGQARDLYRLVVESFQDPWITAGYVLVMILLATHIRHGFWSAFQSLGMHHPRWSGLIYTTGVFVGIVLAVGFIFIPIWLFIMGGAT